MKKTQPKFAALITTLWLGIASIAHASDYGDTVTIDSGTPFWNVIGSTQDCLIDDEKYWINFWKHYTNTTETPNCIAKNCGYTCKGVIVGGHVVFRQNLVKPLNVPGGKDSVYILPICSSHNNRYNTDAMITSGPITAVKLKNYMVLKKSDPNCK